MGMHQTDICVRMAIKLHAICVRSGITWCIEEISTYMEVSSELLLM